MRAERLGGSWLAIVAFAVVGAVTGMVAVGFEEVVKHSLEELAETQSWVIAVTLIAGALAASLLTHFLGGQSSSTTDVYVEQFHDDPPPSSRSTPSAAFSEVSRASAAALLSASKAPPCTQVPSLLGRCRSEGAQTARTGVRH